MENERRDIESDPLGFFDDLAAMCGQPRAYADLGAKCAKYASAPKAPVAVPDSSAPSGDPATPPRMEYDSTRRIGKRTN